MNTLILQTVARFFVPVQLAFSLFLLLRGHNAPGGGFAGGLVVVIALALHAVAFNPDATRRLLRIDPLVLAGVGVLVAILAGVPALVSGEPFLTGLWLDSTVLGFKLGTPFLFDVGVYLLVVGMASGVLLSLMGAR